MILNLIPPSMDGWGHAADEVDSDHGHLVSVHMSLDHRCPKARFPWLRSIGQTITEDSHSILTVLEYIDVFLK